MKALAARTWKRIDDEVRDMANYMETHRGKIYFFDTLLAGCYFGAGHWIMGLFMLSAAWSSRPRASLRLAK